MKDLLVPLAVLYSPTAGEETLLVLHTTTSARTEAACDSWGWLAQPSFFLVETFSSAAVLSEW